MAKRKLSVLEFSEYPGPRYINQGQYSGELFYLEKLNKLFAECYNCNDILVLELDGTGGYPSSFLDEAIGELVYDFSRSVVEKYLEISTIRYSSRREKIKSETYPMWEKKRLTKSTVTHSDKAKGFEVFYLSSTGDIKKKTI